MYRAHDQRIRERRGIRPRAHAGNQPRLDPRADEAISEDVELLTNRLQHWNLVFGICLGFEICNLGLLSDL